MLSTLLCLMEYKFMELQLSETPEKFGEKPLLHSNWCICIQKNDNGRVGGERRSTSLLLMKLTYLFKKIGGKKKKRTHRSNLGRQEFGWMKCFNVKYCGLVLFFLFCSQSSRCNILHIYGHFESRSLKITLLSNYANCIGGGLLITLRKKKTVWIYRTGFLTAHYLRVI